MNEAEGKPSAEMPARQKLIHILLELRYLDDHPNLAAVRDDLKLAAIHVEEAIRSLIIHAEKEN